MKKIDELTDPRSCLNRATDDEPLFVLRANDELAPSVVRQWAQAYLILKGGSGKMSREQLAKCDEAMLIANRMEKWKRDNP